MRLGAHRAYRKCLNTPLRPKHYLFTAVNYPLFNSTECRRWCVTFLASTIFNTLMSSQIAPRRSARVANRRQLAKESPVRDARKEVEQRGNVGTYDTMLNPLAPLPDEIILEICEHILPVHAYERKYHCHPASVATRTFAALAKTCRYLHAFGMRYLYYTYQASLGEQATGFSRTIHRRPELASHIREIYIRPPHLEYHPSIAPAKLSMSPSEFVTEIRKQTLPYEQKWLDVLPAGAVTVDVALLIHHARYSLRSLEMTSSLPKKVKPSPACDGLIWLHALTYASQELSLGSPIDHGFRNLQHLDLDLDRLSISQVAPVMLLPSIKTFNFQRLDVTSKADQGMEDRWPIAPKSSNITSMHILYSKISSELISQMLASCKAITAFRYLVCRSLGDPVKWHAEVIQAISNHSNTIEDLMVDAADWNVVPWRDQWPCIDTIASFQALKHLRMKYSTLMGKPEEVYQGLDFSRTLSTNRAHSSSTLRKLLPSNLTSLSLIYERSSMTQGVDYNSEIRGLLPNAVDGDCSLRDLEIRYVHDDPAAEFPLHLLTLEEQFMESKIDLKYDIQYEMEDHGKYTRLFFLTFMRVLHKVRSGFRSCLQPSESKMGGCGIGNAAPGLRRRVLRFRGSYGDGP